MLLSPIRADQDEIDRDKHSSAAAASAESISASERREPARMGDDPHYVVGPFLRLNYTRASPCRAPLVPPPSPLDGPVDGTGAMPLLRSGSAAGRLDGRVRFHGGLWLGALHSRVAGSGVSMGPL